MTAHLISVDWGTSSLRCYLVDANGDVRDRKASSNGILTVSDGQFENALMGEIGAWSAATPGLPVIMSGMIGSRQGWAEAPYARCPAGLGDLAPNLLNVANSASLSIAIVPGLETRAMPDRPDVMRGEETQIFGALASLDIRDGLFVLPGTHSKWVTVTDHRIVSFATYMTGEVFAALKDHTILGRLMSGAAFDQTGFDRGVAAGTDGAAGDLLNHIFSARTLPLTGQLAGEAVESFLSGLLIGAEIRAGSAHHTGTADTVYVLGSANLTESYIAACKVLGISATPIDGECVVLGHVAIAGAIERPGLM